MLNTLIQKAAREIPIQSGTRRIFLIVFFSAVVLVHHVAQAQVIPNGGFEDWHIGPSGYLDPDGWSANNSSTIPAMVVQGAGRTGNYSLKLLSAQSTVLGGLVDFYYSGNIKPLQVTGFWKGNLSASGEQLVVECWADSMGNAVGWTTFSVIPVANITNWISFSATYNYTSSDMPTGFEIRIFLWNTTSGNATGYIDDLTLTYITSTNEIQTALLLGSSLTQDANENYFLNLNLLSPSTFNLNIFSADGKKVSEKNYSLAAGQHQLPLSIVNLSQGIYFCRVEGGNFNKSFRFIR